MTLKLMFLTLLFAGGSAYAQMRSNNGDNFSSVPGGGGNYSGRGNVVTAPRVPGNGGAMQPRPVPPTTEAPYQRGGGGQGMGQCPQPGWGAGGEHGERGGGNLGERRPQPGWGAGGDHDGQRGQGPRPGWGGNENYRGREPVPVYQQRPPVYQQRPPVYEQHPPIYQQRPPVYGPGPAPLPNPGINHGPYPLVQLPRQGNCCGNTIAIVPLGPQPLPPPPQPYQNCGQCVPMPLPVPNGVSEEQFEGPVGARGHFGPGYGQGGEEQGQDGDMNVPLQIERQFSGNRVPLDLTGFMQSANTGDLENMRLVAIEVRGESRGGASITVLANNTPVGEIDLQPSEESAFADVSKNFVDLSQVPVSFMIHGDVFIHSVILHFGQ